jgi:hypothetical protein
MEKDPDALEYGKDPGVKGDSQGRVIMGRPRILPDFPSTEVPWGDEFQFTLRPVGRGVVLAEGPSYGANSGHWPGQEAFLAEVTASGTKLSHSCGLRSAWGRGPRARGALLVSATAARSTARKRGV